MLVQKHTHKFIEGDVVVICTTSTTGEGLDVMGRLQHMDDVGIYVTVIECSLLRMNKYVGMDCFFPLSQIKYILRDTTKENNDEQEPI